MDPEHSRGDFGWTSMKMRRGRKSYNVFRYLLGSIDCILILPITLFIGFVVAFLPPVFTIKAAQILQRMSSIIPLSTVQQNRSCSRWSTALARLRRYLKIKLTCLGEAIVLRTMLRISGIHSEIKIGINRYGELKAAHAWLEVPGAGINNRSQDDFIEFSRQPF